MIPQNIFLYSAIGIISIGYFFAGAYFGYVKHERDEYQYLLSLSFQELLNVEIN